MLLANHQVLLKPTKQKQTDWLAKEVPAKGLTTCRWFHGKKSLLNQQNPSVSKGTGYGAREEIVLKHFPNQRQEAPNCPWPSNIPLENCLLMHHGLGSAKTNPSRNKHHAEGPRIVRPKITKATRNNKQPTTTLFKPVYMHTKITSKKIKQAKLTQTPINTTMRPIQKSPKNKKLTQNTQKPI